MQCHYISIHFVIKITLTCKIYYQKLGNNFKKISFRYLVYNSQASDVLDCITSHLFWQTNCFVVKLQATTTVTKTYFFSKLMTLNEGRWVNPPYLWVYSATHVEPLMERMRIFSLLLQRRNYDFLASQMTSTGDRCPNTVTTKPVL